MKTGQLADSDHYEAVTAIKRNLTNLITTAGVVSVVISVMIITFRIAFRYDSEVNFIRINVWLEGIFSAWYLPLGVLLLRQAVSAMISSNYNLVIDFCVAKGKSKQFGVKLLLALSIFLIVFGALHFRIFLGELFPVE